MYCTVKEIIREVLNTDVPDSECVFAVVLILLEMFFARLGFAAEAEENRRKSRHGKIKRAHARNPEYPENQERGA